MSIWSAEIKELEKLLESLKGQLPDLEKELGQLIHFDDPNVILLYSRRCLEVIITDLCECELKRPRGTEPLQGIIDRFQKEKKIPANIIASMHGLNELSTFGTHPKDFDPEQVKPVLVNLDIIIKWYVKYKSIEVKQKEEEKIRFGPEKSAQVNIQAGIEQQEKPVKLTKNRLLYGVLITSVLVIAGILLYPKVFKRVTLESLREKGKISVAVIPFQNMTNDTTWNIWQDGIQNELITYLTNSEELKVRQTESIGELLHGKGITNYALITPSVAGDLSEKLDADVFIYGSIKQVGTTIRLNALLIDTKTEETFKSFQIDGTAENILHDIDSLSKKIKNFLIISKLEKEVRYETQKIISTNYPEAYRYFIQGQKTFDKGDYTTAINLLLNSIDLDSNFVAAIIYVSIAYEKRDSIEQAKKYCKKAYEKRDMLPLRQKLYVNWLHSRFFGTPNDEIIYLRELLEIDDQLPFAYYELGNGYNDFLNYEKAIPEYMKALGIYDRWDIKPSWITNYTNLGLAYHETDQYKKEKELYKKAEQDFPDFSVLIRRQAILALTEGDKKNANKYIEKYKSIRKDNDASEADISTDLAWIYYNAGILDKAEEYYRRALSLESASPVRMNNLAYFLIDNDSNINESLGLINAALISSPDDYNFQHTKGWALYKQGNYPEALEVLQKSWDLRREQAVYNHEAFLHLEAAKKAIDNQKNN